MEDSLHWLLVILFLSVIGEKAIRTEYNPTMVRVRVKPKVRVIIIGIDGVGDLPGRSDFPVLSSMANNGFYTYKSTTEIPSFSAECWSSLLYAVEPGIHGCFHHRPHCSPPVPSIFKVLTKQGIFSSSVVVWPVINDNLIEDCSKGTLPLYCESARTTEGLLAPFDVAMDLESQLIFVHIDECDATGHSKGYFSGAHYACLASVDTFLGKLMERARVDNVKTFFMFTSDHGGGGEYPFNHGSAEPQDLTTFFIMSGPGTEGLHKEIDRMTIRDIAPTALRLLGLKAPDVWQGRVPQAIDEWFSMQNHSLS